MPEVRMKVELRKSIKVPKEITTRKIATGILSQCNELFRNHYAKKKKHKGWKTLQGKGISSLGPSYLNYLTAMLWLFIYLFPDVTVSAVMCVQVSAVPYEAGVPGAQLQITTPKR